MSATPDQTMYSIFNWFLCSTMFLSAFNTLIEVAAKKKWCVNFKLLLLFWFLLRIWWNTVRLKDKIDIYCFIKVRIDFHIIRRELWFLLRICLDLGIRLETFCRNNPKLYSKVWNPNEVKDHIWLWIMRSLSLNQKWNIPNEFLPDNCRCIHILAITNRSTVLEQHLWTKLW